MDIVKECFGCGEEPDEVGGSGDNLNIWCSQCEIRVHSNEETREWIKGLDAGEVNVIREHVKEDAANDHISKISYDPHGGDNFVRNIRHMIWMEDKFEGRRND